jgi:uncharacterized protein (TIGR02001 family)
MKKNISGKIILTAVLISALSGPVAFAEEDKPTASGSVSFLSKYMWRGYELSDDNLAIQPSLTLGYKGFAINSWSNLDTKNAGADTKASWTETDLTLSYDTKIGAVGLGGGYIYYGTKAGDTQEFYLKASYDTLLTPTLIVYKDVNSLPGYYCNLGLSHSISLPQDMSLGLSGGLGYYISNTDKILETGTTKKYSGPQDGLLSATLNIPVSKYFTVAPSVSYAFALSNKAKDSLGLTDGKMFGGVTLSIAF